MYTEDRAARNTGGCGSGKTFIAHPTGLDPRPDGGGRYAVHLADQDKDGLLDILETTPFYESGTSVDEADSDEDQLVDGLELQLWGWQEYCSLLHHPSFSGSEEALQAMLRWNASDPERNPLRLNPDNEDMDSDGVKDGIDLQPYAEALFSSDPSAPQTLSETSIHPVIGVHLLEYQTLDPVDAHCYTLSERSKRVSWYWSADACLWWPEPTFTLEIGIGSLTPTVFKTKRFSEFASDRLVSLGSLITDAQVLESQPSPGTLRALQGGLFQMQLPSNMSDATYSQVSNPQDVREIKVRLALVDYDAGDFDDQIDLHPSETETAFTGTHRWGSRSNSAGSSPYIQDFRQIGDSTTSGGRHGDNGDIQAKECRGYRTPDGNEGQQHCVSHQGNQGQGTDAGRIRVILLDPLRHAWIQYGLIARDGGTVNVPPNESPPPSASDPRRIPW